MNISELRTILFRIAPEFITVDNTELDRIDLFIQDSIECVSSNVFENTNKYNLAVVYLTAHNLVISRKSHNSSGLITKENMNNSERTYLDKIPSNELTLTRYGIQFMQLRKTVFNRAIVI